MKKILCVAVIIFITILSLSSCSNLSSNPLKTAKSLNEEGYEAFIVTGETIKEFADEFKVRSKGISCVVVARDEGGRIGSGGLFIYCDDNTTAKNMVEDLEDFIDSNEDFDEDFVRGIVERSGKIVFIGCEDTWEDLQ